MIGISLDIPEVAVRRAGGVPFPPVLNGVQPVFFADFTTEGTTNHYWFQGVKYAGFAAWNTAISGTFTRATNATYFAGGLLQTATSGNPRFPTDASSVPQGLRLSGAQTELAIQNRDLTNVAWTATTATVAKDQTGVDGAATAASSILATAGNATVLQSITSGSASRITGAYVKRLVGTGEIDITQDNGATWTPIVPTASYTFLTLPAATVTNPVIGFRIVTNGDKIAVDFVSQRVAAFIFDVIPTTTVSVTQNADTFIFPTTGWLSLAGGAWAASGSAVLNVSTQTAMATNNAGTFGAGNGSVARVNSSGNNVSYQFAGNGTAASLTTGGSSASSYKFAGIYDIPSTLQRVVDANGTSAENSTLDFTGVNANRLQIGALNSGGSQQEYANVKSIAYWNVSASVINAQLMLMTLP